MRLVTDNHKTNVALFRRFANGTRILQVTVPHPHGYNRPLFLSFDQSRAIKYSRSQLLEAEVRQEEPNNISETFIKGLYELQKDMVIKPVKKHVYPTNLDIFSTEVIAAIEYLKYKRSSHPLAFKYKNYQPTIEYLRVIKKWFDIPNIRNRSHYLQSQNSDKMPFFFNKRRAFGVVRKHLLSLY